MFRLLLERGASVEVKGRDGRTLWQLAISWSNQKAGFFRALLDNADLNVQDDVGKTPLHYAISNNPDARLKALLERGADVHVADINGNTPLHEAARSKRPEAVRLLLQKGADVKAENYAGRTPVQLTSGWRHDPVVILLQQNDE